MAKKLRPLPWEAVEAQHEWLMERFEQGLSCVENPTSHIEGYVEGGVAPRLTVPRSARIQPQSFEFAYQNERHWIYAIRHGDLYPTAPVPFERIHVTVRFAPDLNRWLFMADYQGRPFTVSLSDEYMHRDEDYKLIVARKLTDQFKVYDNEQT